MTASHDSINLEKWKSVVDFSKTMIGLATSVLTVILGLVVVGQLKPAGAVAMTIVLILLSVIASVYSFGAAVTAFGNHESPRKKRAVFCANAAAFLLIGSIALLAFQSEPEALTIDAALKTVQVSASSTGLPVMARNCIGVKRTPDHLEFTYREFERSARVVIDLKSRQISEAVELPSPRPRL
jgi:hypothetical protein